MLGNSASFNEAHNVTQDLDTRVISLLGEAVLCVTFGRTLGELHIALVRLRSGCRYDSVALNYSTL